MHTWDGDLAAYLISPSGRRVELFRNVGYSGMNFTQTTLDDEATVPIGSGTAPFFGRYRPAEPLAAVDGEPINGTWTLEIADEALWDIGSLNGWSLTVTVATPEPIARTDIDGSYAFTRLPAGTYVVREVQQRGWVTTHPRARHVIELGEGEVVEGVDFGSFALPGDADLDGRVSFDDFVIVKANVGRLGGWSDGDFDYDGVVSYRDYVTVKVNFGASLEDWTHWRGETVVAGALSTVAQARGVGPQLQARRLAAPSVPTVGGLAAEGDLAPDEDQGDHDERTVRSSATLDVLAAVGRRWWPLRCDPSLVARVLP